MLPDVEREQSQNAEPIIPNHTLVVVYQMLRTTHEAMDFECNTSPSRRPEVAAQTTAGKCNRQTRCWWPRRDRYRRKREL